MRKKIAITILMVACATCLSARERWSDSLTLEKMWSYAERILREDTVPSKTDRGYYMQYRYNTKRRNFLLLAVPNLYQIAHGRREFAGEMIFKRTLKSDSTGFDLIKQMDVSTVPHHSNAIPVMQEYLSPTIYNENIYVDKILSPFHRDNRVLYKYQTRQMEPGRVEVTFRPRINNTQLVKGSCIVDSETGRVVSIKFRGEFDMLRFALEGTMMEEGRNSLYPASLDTQVRFSLLGNRLNTWFHDDYNLPPLLPDSVRDNEDMKLAEKVRPTPLPEENQRIYDEFTKEQDSLIVEENELSEKRKREDERMSRTLQRIGESLVYKTSSNFGENKGNFTLSPIISPLYFGYNSQRGVFYKIKLNIGYQLSKKQQLSIDANGGYSFKQKLIYYSIPLRYTFNNTKNNYVEFVVGNGNRIVNSEVRDKIKEMKEEEVQNIDWDKLDLDYFKDFRLDLNTNIALSKTWYLKPGITYHRRSAVNPGGFIMAGKKHIYYSTAPRIGVQWKPIGTDNLVITTEYERSIKRFLGSDFNYERSEFDASWKIPFKRMRSLALRAGTGFYSVRGNETYFLDYTNFSQENIPKGWDDNWTGNFQMLDANWYNSSNIYVRGNVTYESPLMIASRLPLVGRFIEMERIYSNILFVERITPYTELGYGFTNRLFSAGVFVAMKQSKWHGIGMRMDLQLFSRW